MENWKDIPEYEGLYQISDFGNVRSIDKYSNMPRGGVQFYKGKQLKLNIGSRGYAFVWLFKNRIKKYHAVHRLVALCFIDNPTNKPDINHKDLKKSNNHYLNLEWCTKSENTKHAYDAGVLTGSFKGTPVKNTVTGEIFNSINEAATSIKIKRKTLSNMLLGVVKNKTNFQKHECNSI